MLEIFAVVVLALGALAVGAAWGRRRAEAGLRPEIDRHVRAEREARGAERAMSELLANASHELRTPLQGIIGTADLLLTAELPEARRCQVEALDKSAETLLTLVDEILDYSKIEAGKLVLRNADFQLLDPLREVVALLASRAAQQGVELHLEADPELPEQIHGDRSRLRQVLFNLVGNAVKFTTKGHVELRVTLEAPLVDGDRHLRFAVRDTGIGISPVDQTRIFAPFAQAESSAAHGHGGTGLGLVISKALVELMGGDLHFESTRGVGSTFWFLLPLPAVAKTVECEKVAPACTSEPRPPRVATRTGSFSILVVDDNPINRQVAESQAEALGYHTESVTGGARALEALAERHFDAVMMDCHMPKLDGYQTARRFRRREKDSGRHTVIIGVTAHAMKGEREKVLAAGMDDFLAKPYRTAQLGAVLERWFPASPEPQPPERPGPEIDQNLHARISQEFIRHGARDMAEIRQALTEGHAGTLEQSAHSLGGSTDFLDAVTLGKVCHELEVLASRGDLDGCKALLPVLEKEYKRLVDSLQ